MKSFKKLASAVALIAGLGVAQQAPAAIQMTLTDGTNTVVINDDGAGDAFVGAGVITFLGSVGCFSINVSTGLGDGATAGLTGIDLNSVNVATCGVSDTLTISFSETGLTSGGSFQGSIGGTLSNLDIFAEMFVGANSFYDETFSIGTFTQTSDGAFAASFSGAPAGLPNPYSMTLVVELTGTSGTASFDFEGKIPEPGMIGLLGLGLAGLGVAMRRRRR